RRSVMAAGTPSAVAWSDSIQWNATRYCVQQAPQLRQGWGMGVASTGGRRIFRSGAAARKQPSGGVQPHLPEARFQPRGLGEDRHQLGEPRLAAVAPV